MKKWKKLYILIYLDKYKVLNNTTEKIEKGNPKLSKTKDGKLKINLEYNKQSIIIVT